MGPAKRHPQLRSDGCAPGMISYPVLIGSLRYSVDDEFYRLHIIRTGRYFAPLRVGFSSRNSKRQAHQDKYNSVHQGDS